MVCMLILHEVHNGQGTKLSEYEMVFVRVRNRGTK